MRSMGEELNNEAIAVKNITRPQTKSSRRHHYTQLGSSCRKYARIFFPIFWRTKIVKASLPMHSFCDLQRMAFTVFHFLLSPLAALLNVPPIASSKRRQCASDKANKIHVLHIQKNTIIGNVSASLLLGPLWGGTTK